jgi:hypothetical protein
MSALSPFREDVELEETLETAAYNYEEELDELEASGAAETVPPPLAAEVEAEDSAEDEGLVGLADPEAEVTHPILTLFPLPRSVLEALAGGLTSAGARLAVAAGYRDVNQLTNIVFYFRHPERIGRKIEPGERELAAEWLSIRDQIVKPALQAAPSAPPAGSPVAAPTRPAGRPDVLSSSRLVWPGSTPEELAFMRAVYDRHAQRSRGDFVFDLPEGALDPIEGHKARTDAAQAARSLLEEARRALAIAHPRAHIGILSAYRPATRQFTIWQGRNPRGRDEGSGFPHYYRKAIAKRIVSAGDFSPDAAEKVAHYLGGYIASPGYSNHQDGLAFDFGVGEVGKGLGRLKKGSWFHRWLQANGRRLHFHPLATEAWHWTYHPPAGQTEVWAGEVASAAVQAKRVEVARVPLLSRHRGSQPDLILRWNDMPSVPEEIDVVVHLHGFWYAGMRLPKDIEPVSGLDLGPIKGESGASRSRPTLTVLPRGHDTGVRQRYKQKDGSYKYGYNVMTFPALVTKDGLSELVRLSLARFGSEVGRGTEVRVGRLILTAHSGGGKALLEILKHHDPDQVHVFDALYWPPGPLVAWARKRIARDRTGLVAGGTSPRDYMSSRGGALRVFYQDRIPGGTRPHSRELDAAIRAEIGPELAVWYRVEASKYDHFQIPRRYGWRVLADASADVPDAYVERSPGRSREIEVEDESLELEDALQWGDGEDLTESASTRLPELASAAPFEESVAFELEDDEAGTFLEDGLSSEPLFEQDAGQTETLPSGAALAVETFEDRPPGERLDEELDPDLVALAERTAAAAYPLLEGELPTPAQRWTPCFSPDEIERLRELYRANDTAAAADPCDRAACIVILNAALGRLLPLRTTNRVARGKTDHCPNGSARTLRMGALSTASMTKAMRALEGRSLARSPIAIDFLAEGGRKAGTLKPKDLERSVRASVLGLSEPPGCWHAFGLSIMDDYHTVLLVIDRTGGSSTIYWLDQFTPDITRDVTAELDDLITTKTRSWWQAVMDAKRKGYDTVVRVWPLGRPIPVYESEPTSRSLRLGHRGPRTQALQAGLQAQGHLIASADGYFGYATDRALRDFQYASRLVDDGIAGPQTLRLLKPGG